MPNPPEPTAPSGEEQAVTIGRETYVRNGTSWRHHHRWGPIVCDETSDILSRLSALHTELERTRETLTGHADALRAIHWIATHPLQLGETAEARLLAVAGEADARQVLGSPDATTRRTE